MSTQPEQILENQLIEQLSNQGYTKISIPDEASLLTNLKTQLENNADIIRIEDKKLLYQFIYNCQKKLNLRNELNQNYFYK